MANFSLNVKVNGVEQSVSTIGELEDALKATRDELEGLEIGSDVFDELSKQARTLDSNLKNITKSVEGVDTAQLAGSFAKLGESITGAFAIATNAVSVFGVESEDVAEAQVKAQQTIAIVLGARAIAEGVVEGAAAARLIVDKVSLVTTGLLTQAFGAQTVATAAQAAATGTATAAQLALNAAMAAAPYALILAVLGGLVALIATAGEDTDEYTEKIEQNTAELEKNSVALESQVDLLKQRTEVQIELARIQGQINAVEEKDAKKRLELVGKTEEEIFEIKKNALQQELDERTKVFGPAVEDASLRSYGILLKQFEDVNEKLLSENEAVRNEAEQNVTELLQTLVNLADATRENVENGVEGATEAAAKQFDVWRTTIQQNLNSIVSIRDDLKILDKQRELDLKETEEEQTKTVQEEAKKRAEAYKGFVEEAKSQLESLKQAEIDLNRQIEDIVLERGVNQDDIVANLELNIEKIKIARERELADTTAAFEKEVEEFIKKEREKGISRKKIDEEVEKQREQFRINLEAINFKYDLQEVDAEKAKADAIADINKALENELTFGGFNLLDSRKALALEQVTFEQDIATRRQAIEDSFYKYIENKIPERQAQLLEFQKRVIEAERLAKLEQAEIDLQNDLLQIQGTEEQKNAQKKALEEEFLAEKKRINEEANLAISEAELAIAENTAAEKRAQLSAYIGFASQGLQALNNLDQAFTNAQLNRAKGNADAEEKIRKESFKRQKALNIVGAVINGAQAVLQAIATFGPPPSPLGIAGIAAAGILTASQIALIASQKYQSSSVSGSITTPSVSIPSVGGASTIADSTGGGFTGFNDVLTGTPTGGNGTNSGGFDPTSGGQRVYVLESDITTTQNKVQVLEGGATFG